VHPAISPDTVKIYYEMPAGAEKIAILNAADGDSVNLNRAVKAMKKDAAQLGANGIVIDKTEANYLIGTEISGTAIFVP